MRRQSPNADRRPRISFDLQYQRPKFAADPKGQRRAPTITLTLVLSQEPLSEKTAKN